MKHTLCDLQEKIFHLQIQLLEEDIAGGERGRLTHHHFAGATTFHLKGFLAFAGHHFSGSGGRQISLHLPSTSMGRHR